MKLDKETVCIVTGGASGIGLATVIALLEYGCKVVAADLNQDSGDKLIKDYANQNLRFFKSNVVDEESVKSLIEFTLNEFNRVTVVVNCAGIAHAAPLVSSKGTVLQNKDLLRVLQINVIGTVNVCKYAAAAMLKNEPIGEFRERGVLINISSVAGFEGQRGQVSYAASKGAVNAMTLPMARDLGRFGIRVVTIAPGIIETPMAHGIGDKYLDVLRKAAALERMGRPEEIAQCVTGLCMNSYITGEVIRVDGGTRFPHL